MRVIKLGNIDINIIRKKGFEEGSTEERIEEYCRTTASQHTDGLLYCIFGYQSNILNSI